MQPDFWHERWAKNQIGFHRDEINGYLGAYLERFGPTEGGHVLVPLCGKSLDLLYLRGQGFRVTGVELSEVACMDFFTSNDLPFTRSERGPFTVFASEPIAGQTQGRIELFCGDFFDFTGIEVPPIDAIYDRAALVALPPTMRPAYVDHLSKLMAPGVKTLLITLDYPQQEMNGPPFSVPSLEVRQQFRSNCQVEKLASVDCLEAEPRFIEKGLSRMDEIAWLLTRRS